MLLMGLIAFAPLAVTAQQDDKKKDDTKKVDDAKKDDTKKDDTKDETKKDDTKKDDTKKDEKKDLKVYPIMGPVESTWQARAKEVGEWWPLISLVLFAGLYFLIIRLRADLGRLEEQTGKPPSA
jgi:hypothetical protein